MPDFFDTRQLVLISSSMLHVVSSGIWIFSRHDLLPRVPAPSLNSWLALQRLWIVKRAKARYLIWKWVKGVAKFGPSSIRGCRLQVDTNRNVGLFYRRSPWLVWPPGMHSATIYAIQISALPASVAYLRRICFSSTRCTEHIRGTVQ